MRKTTLCVTAAMLTAGLSHGLNASTLPEEYHNPLDGQTNRGSAEFSNVERSLKKLDRPFLRNGPVTDPKLFRTITPGLDRASVRTALGDPIARNGSAWDYNFTFALPGSQNFIVCQYKVMFDRNDQVAETIWRRRQCQNLAT